MLRGLFSGSTPSDGLGHPVTAVGDPFQAIYGWRGAAASNIIAFADDFRRVDGRASRRFALTVNRRSGQPILDVANMLSGPLPAQPRRARRRRPGSGCCRRPPGTATRPGAGGDLRQLAGGGRAGSATRWSRRAPTGTAPHWADIAVLTRRNADIAALYAELTARDVPVEIVGLGGLLQLPEIADVLATLRLVDDVTANPDLIRLLTGPRWRIGLRDLALLGRRARELAREPRTPPGRPTTRRSDAARRARRAGGRRRRRRPDRRGLPARRAGGPRRGGLLRRRPGDGSGSWPPSSASCAGTATNRCST